MSGPVLGRSGLVTWAIVGDCLDPSKPASRVASSIKDQGRVLSCISPTLDAKDASSARRQYKKFSDVPADAKIDAVNLCVNWRVGLAVLDEMEARGVRYCFMQPGADRDEVVKRAEELGIVYQRGCMIVEPMLPLSDAERKAVEEAETKKGSDCACSVL